MTETRPLILLTNDDGVRSPGLAAVAEAVCDLADLLLIAPATQQTGMGRGSPPIITGRVIQEQLQIGCHQMRAYSLTGSPAQTVIYGVLVLAPRRPSLVISGINYGENPGTCVTVSGTVGAALQAAEMGIPALAVSLETPPAYHFHHADGLDWQAAAHITRQMTQAVLRAQLPFDVDVLKIDVPADATLATPWRLTRQSRQSYFVLFRGSEPARQAADEPIPLDYTIRVDWDTLEPDSDIYAFAHDRIISVTPLSLDLTARTDFRALEQMLHRA
jgi:5'-nucleotidase